MLGDKDICTMLPVSDMEAAKKFYKETLELNEQDAGEGGVFYQAGNTKVMVYESQYAGTNKGTAANWDVDDVDAVVKWLKDKGVSFERYDFPGAEHEGDVHVMGGMRAAWFKDPSGNILGITQSSQQPD